MTPLLVVAGAAIGAPARFLTDRWIQSRHDSVFPWGTFTVNAVGSFILGAVLGAAAARGPSPHLVAAVGSGFCGALTTYSTFSYETIRLVEDGARRYALLNALGSLAVGLLAAWAGASLTAAALR
jgi:CrcB protein